MYKTFYKTNYKNQRSENSLKIVVHRKFLYINYSFKIRKSSRSLRFSQFLQKGKDFALVRDTISFASFRCVFLINIIIIIE